MGGDADDSGPRSPISATPTTGDPDADDPPSSSDIDRVPVFDALASGFSASVVADALSLEGPGVAVLRHAFSTHLMRDFEAWCTAFHDAHPNPKKDHFSSLNKRIWRLPEKLAAVREQGPAWSAKDRAGAAPAAEAGGGDPALLFGLCTSVPMNAVCDEFLGKYHIGSLAVNTVVPGGPCQTLHTDYPPGFYKPADMEALFTERGLEGVFPYFSLQAGVAVTETTKKNGATEFVVGSHRWRGSDMRVQADEAWRAAAERDLGAGRGDLLDSGSGEMKMSLENDFSPTIGKNCGGMVGWGF